MFVREAAKHNPKDEASERFDLSADDLAADALENRLKSLRPDQVIALCSPCTLKDDSRSIACKSLLISTRDSESGNKRAED